MIGSSFFQVRGILVRLLLLASLLLLPALLGDSFQGILHRSEILVHLLNDKDKVDLGATHRALDYTLEHLLAQRITLIHLQDLRFLIKRRVQRRLLVSQVGQVSEQHRARPIIILRAGSWQLLLDQLPCRTDGRLLRLILPHLIASERHRAARRSQ